MEAGGWVKAHDGTRVGHVVDVEDGAVEFSFQGDNTFQLVLAEGVLEECAALFRKPWSIIAPRRPGAVSHDRGLDHAGSRHPC